MRLIDADALLEELNAAWEHNVLSNLSVAVKLINNATTIQREDVEKDAERFKWIKEQVGYIQGATDNVVTLFQVDATYEFVVKVGKNYKSFGLSLSSAIDKAMLSAAPTDTEWQND